MAAFAEVVQSGPSIRERSPGDLSAPPGGIEPDRAAARSLAALVAGEIVPRLVLAHRSSGPAVAPLEHDAVLDLELAAFTPMTLAGDPQPLLAHVDRLLAGGVTVDRLMLDLLAPAARLLGTWWEEDRCDFVEVTMGLWRLQEVVRELAYRGAPPAPQPGRRVLFAAFPGDQHGFGAVMISEIFLRHGWDAELIVAPDMAALLAAVARSDFDLVGLTVSCDCNSARLTSAILAIRSVSRNPRLRVMIGGRLANEDPALAERAGADGTATDAAQALQLAESLLESPVRYVAGS